MATTNNKRFVRVSDIATLFNAENLQNFLKGDGSTWSFLQTAVDKGVTKDSIIFLNQESNADADMRPDIFHAGARIIIAQGVMYDATTIDKQLLKGWNSSLNITDASINADDNALAAFGKLQGQINTLKQGISDVSVIVAADDAPYASASKNENGVIVIDLSVGTLADASNGKTGLASIEDIYQVLTEDELVWAAALNALNTSINIVNASVINHETRITSLEASIGSLGPDLTQRVTNLEASVGDISTWVNTTKTWIVNTDSSITNIKKDITDINSSIGIINTSISYINTSINNIETSVDHINSSINNIKTDITNINASLSDVSTRIKNLENTSYVNTVGAVGDSWVKANFDASKGNVVLTVGMVDNVIVDSDNITGAMKDTSILTAKAVQDMINNTVTGAVDFLGVFGNNGDDIDTVLNAVATSGKGAKTEYGDFFKFAVDVSANGNVHAYHAGDVFVYNSDNHEPEDITTVGNWTLVHGEPDTDTWRAVKVNGTQILDGTVNGGVALDISAGDAIQVTGDATGAVVINAIDTPTAPWHDATNDWAIL